jgi:hypothetical protein
MRLSALGSLALLLLGLGGVACEDDDPVPRQSHRTRAHSAADDEADGEAAQRADEPDHEESDAASKEKPTDDESESSNPPPQ